MSAIGNLVQGTTVFNLDFLPQNLLIENVNSFFPVGNLSIVTSGVQLMSITSSQRINSIASFDQGALLGLSSRVPKFLKLAVGRINKQTTINITNENLATPQVFASSTGIGGIARRAVEQSINVSANATLENFEALFFDSSNVLRVTLEFENGFIDEYTPQEINGLFASFNACDDEGKLEGLTVIRSETPFGNIVRATIYNGAQIVVVLKTDYVAL